MYKSGLQKCTRQQAVKAKDANAATFSSFYDLVVIQLRKRREGANSSPQFGMYAQCNAMHFQCNAMLSGLGRLSSAYSLGGLGRPSRLCNSVSGGTRERLAFSPAGISW